MTTAVATRAPLARQLRSELRWILRRPRTVIGLGLLCVVPIHTDPEFFAAHARTWP